MDHLKIDPGTVTLSTTQGLVLADLGLDNYVFVTPIKISMISWAPLKFPRSEASVPSEKPLV